MRRGLLFIAAISTALSLLLTVGIVAENLGGNFWDNFAHDDWSLSNLRYGRVVGLFLAMELVTFSLLFAATAGLVISAYLVGLIIFYVGLPALSTVRAILFRRSGP
ncbi:MAG: hypothetical protein J0H20_00495 [Rhizobiales bacterium]|mgnify:CR=1 FL=1|nr:hypothetical protein [Hyphomicrobiales bacterium]